MRDTEQQISISNAFCNKYTLNDFKIFLFEIIYDLKRIPLCYYWFKKNVYNESKSYYRN